MSGAYQDALAEAQRIAEHVRARGVPVSTELEQGVAGSGWLSTTPRAGVLSHHTVARPSMGNTPCLALCKRGRPDVPGPLCNGYMGYDGVYRIITVAWANHPGAGGPTTLAGRTIPRDNGRPYLGGTEYEGGLEPFTQAFRDQMARANLGLLEAFDLPV